MQLAGINVEGHVVERHHAGEALRDVLHGNERNRRYHRLRSPAWDRSNRADYLSADALFKVCSPFRASRKRSTFKITSVTPAAITAIVRSPWTFFGAKRAAKTPANNDRLSTVTTPSQPERKRLP